MLYGGTIFTLKLTREDKGWSFDRRKFTYGFLYGGIIYTLKVTREDKGWSYARCVRILRSLSKWPGRIRVGHTSDEWRTLPTTLVVQWFICSPKIPPTATGEYKGRSCMH